jgi:alkanesulfonate monooxygenase SsuD/methylene tetrahydromethanopterin reductase-like flavin-dependent oxidoreductase (luciferase family)
MGEDEVVDEPLGLMMPFSSGLPVTELAEIGAAAERAGYDWLFLNEHGGDAMVSAAAVAGTTQSARIATGVLNIALRHPRLTAGGAVELLALSGGRFELGLGVGHREVNERALGLTMDRPRDRLIEYMELVRAAAATDGVLRRVGSFYRIDGLAPGHPSVPWPVRIHVGVLSEASARRLAPLVDGIILNIAPIEHMAQLAKAAREAVADAGRDPASLTVTGLVHAVFGSDRSAPSLAHKTSELVAHYGALEAAHASGDDEAAIRAVSDRLLREIVFSDGLGECVARLRAAGIDVPAFYPYAVELGWRECFAAAIETGAAIRAGSGG